MRCLKLIVILLIFLTATGVYAQDKKYEMSSPIEFGQTGWNKVLCMKNGNTILFHFDPTKPVVVKVFDSAHKHIAGQEYLCSVLDINRLRTAVFKGGFAINGEAVLFIEQEHLGKQDLVRLRFNGGNGKLIEEKLVGESPSLSKRTRFYVMKNKQEEHYAILFSTEERQFNRCDNHVTYYDHNHEPIKDIPLEVDRRKYDYMDVVGAETQPNGILITLDLMKIVSNATVSGVSPQREIDDHHLAIYYIPKDSSKVHKKVVDVSTDVFPYYTNYSYNPFANTLNLLVFSYRELYYRFGVDISRITVNNDLFFKIEEDNSDIKFNWVKNDKVNASFKQKTDTSKNFYGMPLNMFTNENGLTTIITEGYERYDEPESKVRYNYESYYGNIGITQVDDDGNELWGTVLPHAEYYKSYRHYYHPKEVAKKNHSHRIFDDLPDQITTRQFVSLNSYSYKNNLYIIFNDDNRNFNNLSKIPGDTVYQFENTNACYYKMNSKKEITKSFLFDEPARNEYRCSFIEGADFDEQRGVYVTLVQYKRNDNITLRMAWRHLD